MVCSLLSTQEAYIPITKMYLWHIQLKIIFSAVQTENAKATMYTEQRHTNHAVLLFSLHIICFNTHRNAMHYYMRFGYSLPLLQHTKPTHIFLNTNSSLL